MSGPMEGLRVVENGVWVAGPGAAGLLADWGADVIKVEPPRGDPSRLFARMLGGDMDVNPVFLDNRAKRGIVVDLTTTEGMDILHRLLAEADVFVTNIRAAALDRLGLGPDELTARYQRLVYALLTGYGIEGDDADRPAYDIAAYWARSGMAESLRAPGGPLPFQRGGMGDHTVAMTGAAMIGAALYERERTGRGQFVSTSLLRQGAYTLGFDVNIALMWGRSLSVGVRETMGNPSVNNYRAGDGRQFWIVGLEGDRHWPPLARAVGHPEWITDARFATARDRFVNARELIVELDTIFATRSLEEWAAVFDQEPELFWTPVNTIDDLLADAQFHAAGGVVHVPDDDGTQPMVASPVDFAGTTPQPRFRAPRLGEHTMAVLDELGYGPIDIEGLIERGVVGTGPP